MYQLTHNQKIVAVITACLLIGGITMSFQNVPFGPFDKLDTLTGIQDTIPEKQKENEAKLTITDFDQLMQKMNEEMGKMQKEITKIDLEQMHKDLASSLDKVNFDQINSNIDKAMKDVDFEKIEKSIKTALKEVDWNELNEDIRISLQEAKKEIDKINMEDVKKEIRKAKDEIEKSKNEIKKINIDELMKTATAGILSAKEELRLTKEMFNEMEKDGLINQKEGFTIEFKDKTLMINGKIQSEAVKEKYQRYIKGDSFKISIGKEKQ